MAYVPASKLSSYPGQGTSTAGASPEGINAFLSRVRQAQNDADQAADLKMQEQVASGTVNVDQQIQYNKDRQQRFLPSTKEYQQLANNIADLNVAKKWQVLSTMDATGKPKADQIQYLNGWLQTLTPNSDLANQMVDRIGKLQIQANQEHFAREYQAKVAQYNQNRQGSQEVVAYLQSQLASATDDVLKTQIQNALDNQKQGILDDAYKFARTAATAFDNTGTAESEGRELGLLENAKQKAQSAGDAAGVANEQGNIDTAQRRLVAATIDDQITKVQNEAISKPGDVATDQKLVSIIQGLQAKNSGDFTYPGSDGTTKTLHLDNLQTMTLNSGTLGSGMLSNSLQTKLSSAIQGSGGLIDDKVHEISTKFTSLSQSLGASYDRLLPQAQAIAKDWGAFKSQQFMAPFSGKINEVDQTILNNISSTLVTTAQHDYTFSTSQKEGATQSKYLGALDTIQKMFPTIAGADFQAKYVDPAHLDISKTNFGELNNKIQQQIDQTQAAITRVQNSGIGNPNGPDVGQLNTLNKDLFTLHQAQSQYGQSSYLNTHQPDFLPDKSGNVKALNYSLPKTSGLANTLIPLPKQVSQPIGSAPKPPVTSQPVQNKNLVTSDSIRVPNLQYLSKYKPGETFKDKTGNIYLNAGVDKRW